MPPSENSSPAAAALQSHIQAYEDYSHVTVTARGRQLYIRVDEEVIARVEQTGSTHYALAFRNHAGRWEPLPVQGTLAEVSVGVIETLAPYLRRYYP